MSNTREQIIGNPVFRFAEVVSTNDTARKLWQEQIILHGAVVYADFQTGGRGQAGATWESEAGMNLTCTYLLEPESLPADKQAYLNMAICLGIQAAIQELSGVTARIKWPNDVYIGELKLAGVLIESVLQQQLIKGVLVGIGLNVNQHHFQHPFANSLSNISGHPYAIEAVLETLSRQINLFYGWLMDAAWDKLKTTYEQALFLINTESRWESNGTAFTGIIRGVDEFGRLKMDIAGEMRLFNNKEVIWVR